MNRLFAIFICCIAILVTGCDPIAHSVVGVDFPVSQQQTVTLSTSNLEVQEAMRIIDEVLAANGFVRDTNLPTKQDQANGIIATYGTYDVYIKGHRLIVNFVEFGKYKSSPIVVQTCSLLKNKLSDRFGDQRVCVESNTSQNRN